MLQIFSGLCHPLRPPHSELGRAGPGLPHRWSPAATSWCSSPAVILRCSQPVEEPRDSRPAAPSPPGSGKSRGCSTAAASLPALSLPQEPGLFLCPLSMPTDIPQLRKKRLLFVTSDLRVNCDVFSEGTAGVFPQSRICCHAPFPRAGKQSRENVCGRLEPSPGVCVHAPGLPERGRAQDVLGITYSPFGSRTPAHPFIHKRGCVGRGYQSSDSGLMRPWGPK